MLQGFFSFLFVTFTILAVVVVVNNVTAGLLLLLPRYFFFHHQKVDGDPTFINARGSKLSRGTINTFGETKKGVKNKKKNSI